MGRRCSKSIDEQIRTVQEQLEKYQAKVGEIQEELKRLQKLKRIQETELLLNYIETNNLTVDDAMTILDAQLKKDENIA